MNLGNNIKKMQMAVPIIFFFLFIRSIVFANEDLIGFIFEKKEITFNLLSVFFYFLIIFYSALTSFFVFNVFRKYSSNCWLPCLLLFTDTVFLINQRHISVLFVHVLWLLYLNNRLIKNIFLKNLSQILFLFAAAIVSPKVTLGFVPLVILSDYIFHIDKAQKDRTIVITRFSSVLVTIFGIIANKILCDKFPAYKSFLDFLNPSHFSDKNKMIGVFVLSIPSIIIGVYFIYILMKKNNQSKKKDKKTTQNHDKNEKLLNIIISACSVLFIGCIIGGYETISTLSLFVPVIILSLIFTEDKAVILSLSDIHTLIVEHPTAAMMIFVSVCYACLRFYLWQFGASVFANFFIWSG